MTQNKKKFLPYEVVYKKPADKFFKKHEDVREEYINALWELYCGEQPEQIDLKTIQGKRGTYYRIRLGGWRVIFMLEGEQVIVINTLMAGSRGDIYKKISGLKSIVI